MPWIGFKKCGQDYVIFILNISIDSNYWYVSMVFKYAIILSSIDEKVGL